MKMQQQCRLINEPALLFWKAHFKFSQFILFPIAEDTNR